MLQAVAAAVAAAARPYVFEHAARFAQELLSFAASGRSIAAHDLATGVAGPVAMLQPPARHCPSRCDSAHSDWWFGGSMEAETTSAVSDCLGSCMTERPLACVAAAAAGRGSRPTAATMVAATSAEEEDGSRESGELSPTQPSDSPDARSSGGAGAADAAASSGGTCAAAAGGPAAGADAGSGARRSPSPDRGSDCLSLSVGSDFGWVCCTHPAADCCGAVLVSCNSEGDMPVIVPQLSCRSMIPTL